MKCDIVVTRHRALVDYLHERGFVRPSVCIVPHIAPGSEVLITGKNVVGVLPMHLAALTNTFTEVPLMIPEEVRMNQGGRELTLEQVREFAREPVTYKISKVDLITEVTEE